MDNLFDLNDYEEQEGEIEDSSCTESPQNVLNREEVKINLDEAKENLIIIDKVPELAEPSSHDDSFETKIAVAKNKNLVSAEAKGKCVHAVDDTIDIKEFDKIKTPAMAFPFELDVFQKRSIVRLENHQNVLVCAHTSSGKTVVAEYAIALGRSMGKRVIYTSPIKALSNQKYREFKGKFGDVGILTGDVSINADAQCVIMTTEILQSSLYKNSEMLNMVEWVVFDEVHYINDNERGHVWEEILILLPPRIGIVMLSATVPNYLDFAKWVGRIKNTTIYIQNTLKRVVPLEHKIFIASKKVFVVKDKSDKVLESNIVTAMKELEEVNQKEYKNKGNPKNKKDRENYEAKKLDQVRSFYRDVERKEKENFNRQAKTGKDTNTNSGKIGNSNNNSFNKGYNNFNQNNSSYNNSSYNNSSKGSSSYNNSSKGSSSYNNFNSHPKGGNGQSTHSNQSNQSNQSNNTPAPYRMNRYTMTHMKLEEIVKFLFDSEMTPAVVFVFSIKKIDEYGRLMGIEPRVSKAESSKIISFFDKCMSKLSDEDKQINQIQVMRRILPQGIGVHHAGLLPILKETIEILYSNGLIKILFATTSFSIGLNMPTRTVVFTDIEKYNDERKEVLSSSEYLQMCGRAGRRGIDQLGHIFLLMGDKKNPPQVSEISQMMGGKGTHVESKFRLSYRTIISFLSRNVKNIMEFFKESYLENNKILIMPETMKEIEEIKEKLLKMPKVECKFPEGEGDEFIRKYFQDEVNILSCRNNLFAKESIGRKLTPGRLVIIKDAKLNKDYAALILHYYSEFHQYRCITAENNEKLVIGYELNKPTLHEGVVNKIYFKYQEIQASNIVDVLDLVVKFDVKTCLAWGNQDYCFVKQKEMDRVLNCILEVSEKLNSGTRKTVDYLKISSGEIDVFELVKKKEHIEKTLKESKCEGCEYQETHLTLFRERKMLEDKFHEKTSLLSSENLKYYNDFKSRVDILKSLGYIDQEDQILLKGKAARELATSDCVLISELLMSNILDKLDVPEIVAFISGFAFSKNEIEIEDPYISDNFSFAVKEFGALLDTLINLEQSKEFEESKYNRRITFAVSKSVHLWMSGHKFRDILDDTDLEAGKLYNLIMRLYLFLEEIKNFYTTLGNAKLAEKFGQAKELIMRDILSCRSLYLQEDVDIDNI